ncbi:MAG TPA: alpha/beta hydrolase [Clostridia bacterium]|jgi:pimeloyl-ACP methyl ester carboxylesterase|nr:alpha/beta hydrolase [Clostridiaceae bacterium]HOF25849.1 alpha/beta hydrolase [Clostridia bacterium]HOM33708.1 alpha/beta hydrolase [Clostridia bacterium]HOR88874.1 alpha/beta hydrolase [Clostridia bacterium]HOT71105.1 alpha/beta hydrolase [Clostridia bacterium]
MNISLNYVESGTGDVLILLHGNSENYEIFKHQIDYFSSKYRVIAIDTRGHGNSPRGDAPFTLNQFAEDLNDFFLQHKISKANILGFSDGGNIAMIFTMKYPEKVSKLILNGANLNPDGVKGYFNVFLKFMYKIFKCLSKISKNSNKYLEMMSLMVNEPDIDVNGLKKISVPTLVIAGTNDLIKEEHTRLIASAIPDSKLVFIKGDHFIVSKKPEEFNDAVNSFLNN